MKKRFLVFIAAIIVTAALSASMLCGCDPTTVIDDFREEVMQAESGRIYMCMEVPEHGKISMTMYVDGDKTYTLPFSGSAIYTEREGVVLNTYTDNGSYWRKESDYILEDETESVNDEYLSLLYGYNYEYSSEQKAFYKKPEVSLRLGDIEFYSLWLTIYDGICEMSGKAAKDNELIDFSIKISELNNVDLVFDEIVTGEVVSD